MRNAPNPEYFWHPLFPMIRLWARAFAPKSPSVGGTVRYSITFKITSMTVGIFRGHIYITSNLSKRGLKRIEGTEDSDQRPPNRLVL